MDTTNDVRDILDVSGSQHDSLRESVFGSTDSSKKKKLKKADIKKPEGMHRELWGLLWNDNMDAPPVIPTDTGKGYKSMKAKLGSSKVRPWVWMQFSNPARKDGAIFYHWRRKADEGKDYPFAAFNKGVDVTTYTDLEYQQHLHNENWSRQETDHLISLAKQFDLRFVVMHDRWNRDRFSSRSVEDIKERYYNISNTLARVRAAPGSNEARYRIYDAEHERKRKLQLVNLYDRTEEQIEEEQMLINELKRIEMRKRERDRKTQDLQKLITAAETNAESSAKKTEKKFPSQKKKLSATVSKGFGTVTPEGTGIKFSDVKQSGVSLRSQRMKLPSSVGQKKIKALDQVLGELEISPNPIPTEDIVTQYNELRQEVVLLYELKLALASCEYELQTMKHRIQTLAPDRSVELPEVLVEASKDETVEKKISQAIDCTNTPNRKRRAALEQSNILKKIKQKY